jgi:capsular polysaccharide export protein
MQRHADQVVTDIAMPVCLAAVDAVHTMSSLTGFEALLRGLAVTCYGLPFYAGWGLTTDKAQNAVAEQAKQRRARTQALSLTQLVYATLIDYPLYRIPQGYGLAQVEQVIDYLYPTSVDDQFNAVQPSAKSSFTQQAKLKLMQTRQRIKRRLPKADANDA